MEPSDNKLARRGDIVPVHWCPSKIGSLKLNIDGSILEEDTEGAVTGACHNPRGKLLARFTKTVLTPLAEYVEALALKEARSFLTKNPDI